MSARFDSLAPVASVLHVEDDPTTQAVMVRLTTLSGRNLDLSTAGSVAEALSLLEVMIPDLVLLDMMLPDGLGEAVLRALRADQRTHHVPVVVVSSRTNPELVKRMMDLGANAYITKPFAIDDVLNVLRSNGASASAAHGPIEGGS